MMNCNSNRFFILTGGPGSGKSTLIAALAENGHAHSVEAGRAIIQNQQLIDGPVLPWRDPLAFAEMMLSWEMRSYRMAEGLAGPVFFDRGIPDIVGFLRLVGKPVPTHMDRAARSFLYSPRVFVLPPWPEIYRQDSERRQTFEEAEKTYETMLATYQHYGYAPLIVPRRSVSERLVFVMRHAGHACSVIAPAVGELSA